MDIDMNDHILKQFFVQTLVFGMQVSPVVKPINTARLVNV